MTKKNETALTPADSLADGKLSAEALAALSLFGLAPHAAISALGMTDATKAMENGATKKVLREIRALAQSVGIDFVDGAVLDRKPRESKPSGRDSVLDEAGFLPPEWRVQELSLDADGGTCVTLEDTDPDGHHVRIKMESVPGGDSLRLGTIVRLAIVATPAGDPQR